MSVVVFKESFFLSFIFNNDCEKSLGGRLLDKSVKAMHCVPGGTESHTPTPQLCQVLSGLGYQASS